MSRRGWGEEKGRRAEEDGKGKRYLIAFLSSSARFLMDLFTVVNLVPRPLSESEADGDLVLIYTSFALIWKLTLKNTS